jgi:2'-5' RNA ligase
VRLFFALLPDTRTSERVSSAAARIEMVGRARMVAPANFHITLAFVGEVPDCEAHIFREMGAALSVPRCVIELNVFEY